MQVYIGSLEIEESAFFRTPPGVFSVVLHSLASKDRNVAHWMFSEAMAASLQKNIIALCQAKENRFGLTRDGQRTNSELHHQGWNI